jgi:hypothetical protein
VATSAGVARRNGNQTAFVGVPLPFFFVRCCRSFLPFVIALFLSSLPDLDPVIHAEIAIARLSGDASSPHLSMDR